ncbi:MAG: hypothetical protein KJO79_03060, partial [Verrucomicrobiae bacterium]|nr:hypothetical protein [Verrucomicrobiae bacterium]
MTTRNPLILKVLILMAAMPATAGELHLVCSPTNDLHQVLVANKVKFEIHDKAGAAVAAATHGSAVMILADGYPAKPTQAAPAVFEQARKKRLRLFIEFPSALPGLKIGKPRRTRLERAVVASDFFG